MNNVTPLAETPWPRPYVCRLALSNVAFHCSSKPGFDIESTEIFASVRIHDVRCASPRAVSHSDPPRPTCAYAVANSAPAARGAVVIESRLIRRRLKLSVIGYRLTPKQ